MHAGLVGFDGSVNEDDQVVVRVLGEESPSRAGLVYQMCLLDCSSDSFV